MATKIANWLQDLLDAIDGDERFLMTLGAGMVNTILVWAQVIDQIVYRDLTLGTVAVFIGASAYTAGVQIRQAAQITMNEADQSAQVTMNKEDSK